MTTLNRELMMQAKEVTEDMGLDVLHMYVDCLFVRKEGLREQRDFSPLLEAIHVQIGIPIVLDGIYKWLVFPASKRDGRTPMPNRYFGAFKNGELKYRGVALRRHDTCRFVAETQLGVLKILAQTDHPEELVPQAYRYVERQIQRLKSGKVSLDDLRVAKKLSRELDAYRVPSPAALAARQIQENGGDVRAGLRVQFWYVYGGVKVRDVDSREIDVGRYCRLIDLAVEEVLGSWQMGCEKFQQYELPAFLSPKLHSENAY